MARWMLVGMVLVVAVAFSAACNSPSDGDGDADNDGRSVDCMEVEHWECRPGSFRIDEGGTCTAECPSQDGTMTLSCGLEECSCECFIAGETHLIDGGISLTPTPNNVLDCCSVVPDQLWNLGCCARL